MAALAPQVTVDDLSQLIWWSFWAQKYLDSGLFLLAPDEALRHPGGLPGQNRPFMPFADFGSSAESCLPPFLPPLPWDL